MYTLYWYPGDNLSTLEKVHVLLGCYPVGRKGVHTLLVGRVHVHWDVTWVGRVYTLYWYPGDNLSTIEKVHVLLGCYPVGRKGVHTLLVSRR